MKHRLLLFVILAVLGSAALAGEYRLGDLIVHGPWAREMPPTAETAAVYFRIENSGSADRIVSAHSPYAERAELHTHELEDGVMKMGRVAAAEVPAGGELAFEPGGHHVMLVELDKTLIAGASFPMTIRFELAGEVEVRVRIRAFEEVARGAQSSPSDNLPA